MNTPSEGIILPDWLEEFRQNDEIQAASYEDCPADFRARLKTAIAFAFHLWGSAAAERHDLRDDPRSGFAHGLHSRPAAWTIALLSPDYSSPARFIAALLPAILAGCKQITVVCPRRSPLPALCTALELSGLEDIFILPQEEKITELLREMLHDNQDGRLLLFPGHSGEFSALRHAAAKLDCPSWQDNTMPRLAVMEEHTEDLRCDIIEWAQGCHLSEDADQADALFLASAYGADGRQNFRAPLIFGPGMEGCWMHRNLTPDFFRTSSLCASFCAE